MIMNRRTTKRLKASSCRYWRLNRTIFFALYYLGVVHYMQDNANKAIPYLEKASQSPTQIEGLEALLASVYLGAGKAEKALSYYSKQYEANPEDELISYQYASSLKGVGREDEAIGIFKNLIKKTG